MSHNHEHTHEHLHEHDHSHNHENFEQTKKAAILKIAISALFFAAGYICEEFFEAPKIVVLICFIVSYIAVGFEVVKDAIEDIFDGKVFNECFLMSIASLGAFVIGEYSEGCAVMLLYSIGEFIHGAAISKSKKAIRAIESESGAPHIHEKSENESFIATFAKIYTPIICVIAILVVLIPPIFLSGEWREWIYRGLSVLVIGCPCAIVISVPLSFSCAIDACTRNGIYIYHTNALERLYKSGKADGGILIENGDESKLAFAKKAAKKAFVISRENIAVAITVKVVVLILAVFLNKELPMWLAAFSDVGISFIAILNSLRSLRIRVK
jgi:cation transport ATPase